MKLSQLPVKAAVALIKIYRKNISPFKPPCCRFTPTCSEYALEAFRTHGFIRGFFLSLRRILRCHPFCKGGYDPVPEKTRRSKLSKWKVF
ncbi:MAG: membrane protein insertion efficiency factor YidD [Clostridia bacterium]|nr:membrane protein insertion efficiency factor YidD [Clostridia bacterium]MBO5299137.1 membrane protein insertion efficiency factor YidD [Clostridia bacterium]MBQ2720820.1 membrane protein insertion efficiency factor YidD [Clostridia bacterium]MBQ4628585.1 membrane protein insertion efficiency factor YidD [Clostridia bacterium]